MGRNAGGIGDRHLAEIAQHEKGCDWSEAAKKERGERRLPDRCHAMRLVFVRQFTATDEADRHQQKDGDRIIEFLGDLDATMDPRANDPEQEAERNRRQQIAFERLQNTRELIPASCGEKRGEQLETMFDVVHRAQLAEVGERADRDTVQT